jgi:hypothetical protein
MVPCSSVQRYNGAWRVGPGSFELGGAGDVGGTGDGGSVGGFGIHTQRYGSVTPSPRSS